MIKGFFAYTSRLDIRECISSAVQIINKDGQYAISTWEEMSIAGNYVIDSICEKIDEADLFLVDLTYVNHNVLFELGYAIARNKRVVIFLDITVKNSKQNYDRLNFSSIGYIEFKNSSELATRFLSENILKSLNKTILNRLYGNYPRPPVDNHGILYLKSIYETDASIKLSKSLEKSKIKPLVIDDPTETLTSDVEWYLKYSVQSYAVVGHLIDSDRETSEFHNAKVSFCMGMGFAFGKKVLLLVKEPFESPIDYKHLLKKHKTLSECSKIVNEWITNIETTYTIEDVRTDKTRRSETNSIKEVDIGDYIAEQEIKTLFEYYVPIFNLKEALRSDYSLFIGRKGTGKSAFLYKIEHDLLLSSKDHVCVIKPVGYEIGGLLQVLRDIPEESEKSYLMESLWKYLIYTELAKSIKERMEARPVYIDKVKQESELMNFIEQNSPLIMSDFWTRFENIISTCSELKTFETGKKLKISEFLHDNMISKLKSLLVDLISTSYEKIVILVDNLDKTWKFGEQTEVLSAFLFGLISVSSRVKSELSPRSSSAEFSLLIFLRSDIFSYIFKIARERDKLKYQSIDWNDPELLLQVIEERLIYNFPEYSSSQIWDTYFCKMVEDLPVKDFIVKNIVPRPRDIVFLVLEALKITIAKKHERIEENDLLNARLRYSQYALDSLLVESEINANDLEKLLYEFVGCDKIISKNKLLSIIETTLEGKYSYDEIVQLLCERSFLGRQVAKDEFKYQYGFGDAIIKAQEKAFILESGKIEYEINTPYRRYLEIR